MKCALLMLDRSPITSITGPMEIISLANSLVDPDKRLSLELVSTTGQPVTCLGGLTLSVHGHYRQVEGLDLILIGAIGHPAHRESGFDVDVLQWLIQQHALGTKIVSICTGAFVLAATGLLDGKQATTHWQCASLFKESYPQVILRSEKMITQQGNLYCSGGASAYQDMSLYLVREFFGDAVAQYCAKAILIDSDRYSQAHYASYQPSRHHNDALVHKIQDWLRDNLDGNLASNSSGEACESMSKGFSITDLAKMVHLSERQFKRRFKQATNESPLAYVQALRVEMAKHLLEVTGQGIEAVSRAVGYEDVRFFRQIFKRIVGLSPSEYRQKFALMA
jgi:transcriptional regulator GlxA family with amidase domain